MDLKHKFNFLFLCNMRRCPICDSDGYSQILTEEIFKIVKCNNCSLIYLLNPPDESEIYEDYYEIEYKGKDYNENSNIQLLSEIFAINKQRKSEILKIKNSGELLDFGCGSGLFLKTMSDSFNVSGIDVSKKSITFAKEEFGLIVSNENADDLLSKNKKFDIITLWHVLEHFLSPVDELKKIRNLLNDNGVLIVEVPNWESIKFQLSGKKWVGGNHPQYHRSFFTEKTLSGLFQTAGFSGHKNLNLSYDIAGKSKVYNLIKKSFNLINKDAFLNFIIYK
ncbi:MAG TPA: class I SAM-dependent methyltransferase [Ignavibacteria bacterium]|nr:class I SAM-dependent methyltransferase [Ignavibacteria bacterium]